MAENSKLVTLLKKNPDESESFYADKLNIPKTQIGPLIWFNEPIANPKLKFPGNKANIVKARKDGIRWERIAARTGKSVAECKEIGGKEAAEIYTGRGRPVGSYTPGKSGGSGKKQAGRGTSGRRQAQGNKQAGRRGGGARAGRRTRAEAGAKDPK
jgi:hypothetical protein